MKPTPEQLAAFEEEKLRRSILVKRRKQIMVGTEMSKEEYAEVIRLLRQERISASNNAKKAPGEARRLAAEQAKKAKEKEHDHVGVIKTKAPSRKPSLL